MSNRFNDSVGASLRSAIPQRLVKIFGANLAGMALACFGLANLAQAQTSVVCDPAGDAIFSSGKGGPAVPPWLDIVKSEIDDSGSELLFTLKMNAPIPLAPAWSGVDDGGQLWWGWRIITNLANSFGVQNGCVVPNGSTVPVGYFLDLIWSVTTSSFQARLLDDTSCTPTAVPFSFSADRTQLTLVVSKSLFNAALIPDPDNFQYLAAIEVWKSNATGNKSFFTVDLAPNLSNRQLVAVTFSTSSNTSYFCP